MYQFIIYEVHQQKKRKQRTKNLSQGIKEISIWISPKKFLNNLYSLFLFSNIVVILCKSLKTDQLYLCL